MQSEKKEEVKKTPKVLPPKLAAAWEKKKGQTARNIYVNTLRKSGTKELGVKGETISAYDPILQVVDIIHSGLPISDSYAEKATVTIFKSTKLDENERELVFSKLLGAPIMSDSDYKKYYETEYIATGKSKPLPPKLTEVKEGQIKDYQRKKEDAVIKKALGRYRKQGISLTPETVNEYVSGVAPDSSTLKKTRAEWEKETMKIVEKWKTGEATKEGIRELATSSEEEEEEEEAEEVEAYQGATSEEEEEEETPEPPLWFIDFPELITTIPEDLLDKLQMSNRKVSAEIDSQNQESAGDRRRILKGLIAGDYTIEDIVGSGVRSPTPIGELKKRSPEAKSEAVDEEEVRREGILDRNKNAGSLFIIYNDKGASVAYDKPEAYDVLVENVELLSRAKKGIDPSLIQKIRNAFAKINKPVEARVEVLISNLEKQDEKRETEEALTAAEKLASAGEEEEEEVVAPVEFKSPEFAEIYRVRHDEILRQLFDEGYSSQEQVKMMLARFDKDINTFNDFMNIPREASPVEFIPVGGAAAGLGPAIPTGASPAAVPAVDVDAAAAAAVAAATAPDQGQVEPPDGFGGKLVTEPPIIGENSGPEREIRRLRKVYHPNSLLLFFQSVYSPKWDLELERDIKATTYNKFQRGEIMDNIVKNFGEKIFVTKRFTSTLEELIELVELQFCVMRNLSLGNRGAYVKMQTTAYDRLRNSALRAREKPSYYTGPVGPSGPAEGLVDTSRSGEEQRIAEKNILREKFLEAFASGDTAYDGTHRAPVGVLPTKPVVYLPSAPRVSTYPVNTETKLVIRTRGGK